MQNRPDASQLSHAQKDELIAQKDELIASLTAQVVAMQGQLAELQGLIAELQSRLALNSKNSSKPPSSDGLNKPKPKSLRKSGERKSGGQKGHPGQTLSKVADPDIVVMHAPPAKCDACQRGLANADAVLAESRQVFDLPPLRLNVTEHQVLQTRCVCGKTHRGQFPEHVPASVQYGAAALAAMVHLNLHHMVPAQRTAGLMGEFFDMPVSQATVLKAGTDAKERLTPTVDAIAQALQTAPVVQVDETGLRVNKTLYWMHVAATRTLTWLGCHAKRGKAAFDELGILTDFKGTLIHDGWKPYRALDCIHGLCNAHHLRELTYVFEELKQDWAGDMIELLTHANHTDNVNCANGARPQYDAIEYQHEVQCFRSLYEAILDQGDAVNPRAQTSGKRGRTKQSKPANLLIRLREHADDVWRFMTDFDVPFTNNVAEQAFRMCKVKQKISGCFRTIDGAKNFCVVRSYLATMHKQGANLFESLVKTFQGSPPQPRLC
jgi:transposase